MAKLASLEGYEMLVTIVMACVPNVVWKTRYVIGLIFVLILKSKQRGSQQHHFHQLGTQSSP